MRGPETELMKMSRRVSQKVESNLSALTTAKPARAPGALPWLEANCWRNFGPELQLSEQLSSVPTLVLSQRSHMTSGWEVKALGISNRRSDEVKKCCRLRESRASPKQQVC